MGSGWMIKTFDRARWDGIFGSGSPDAEQKILDAMLWDNDGYFDDDAGDLSPGPNREQVLSSQAGEQAKVLARHLAMTGFTYEGLDAEQAIQLDEFGAHMASVEALGNELGIKWHSPDFFHQSYAAELFDRTGNNRSWSSRISFFGLMGRQPTRVPVQYLPFLITGRRFGTNDHPTKGYACYYVVFSPAEVMALKQEVVAARDASVPWRDKSGPTTIDSYLLAPLNRVIESGRWVLMTLNY